ncbi:hypothetical protein [Methylobacterium sp.]|uniref:hypothetical protein n=1 Tax=Methylobacterium sp. TaxID=409 RepID=UPI002582A29E|nr:hypothetical protein [Methylobacterium sp.]
MTCRMARIKRATIAPAIPAGKPANDNRRFIEEVAAHTTTQYVHRRGRIACAMLVILLVLSGGLGLSTLLWLSSHGTELPY